jgi:Xaa-Pro aminopeptidase
METPFDNLERKDRIRAALHAFDVSALICSHNINVLMLSGYWPVTGTAVAIATAERLVLLVPEEERTLAQAGWADDVHTFAPATLASLQSVPDAASAALKTLLPALGLQAAHLACEAGAGHVPAAYVDQFVYGCALQAIVHGAVPRARLSPASEILDALRLRPTRSECERIRLACRLAAGAYEAGAARLAAGVSEMEAVLPFQQALSVAAAQDERVTRAEGFFYCMSGANAAQAYAAFQRSRHRRVQAGEPILIHCNSCVDGYWTDLTRTYVLGEPAPRLAHMFAAVSTAREAALDAIGPGVPAAEVDRAARAVLAKSGYGGAFKHATGHGVGFGAIDHAERPCIHPRSTDVLESGMVFNIEPGVYLDGYGGVRDCNMVLVTDTACELLSPFHMTVDDWQLTH